MNIHERANKLKRFIEICDSELFPHKPLGVHCVNKRYAPRGMVALNILRSRNCKYYIDRISLFSSIISGYFSSLSFKKTKWSRRFLLQAQGAFRFLKISSHTMWYEIKNCRAIGTHSDLEMVRTACHEVRHRVQIQKAYEKGEISLENEEKLRIIFKGNHEMLRKLFISTGTYANWEINREIDAHFIAMLMESYMKAEIKTINASISEESFRAFVRSYSHLMKWKNPDLEL